MKVRTIIILMIILPMLVFVPLAGYVGVVFVQWQQDRDLALDKLSRYKRLIDRTEELQQGLVYSRRDVDLTSKVVDIPTRIYDRHGELIGEFFDQKREIVPYKSIPQWIVKGVVASEDRAFYEHDGISPRGIFRAMATNIMKLRVAQGGSTITQQLAKVLFTDMERNLRRKIYEAFCAREIEERYDKQDILSMYLNLIYFGNGSYGVQSTSRMFFGQPVEQCGLAESAMIVATISNPKYYSPLSNITNSVVKTRRILVSMVDAGFIARKQAELEYKAFLKRWKISFDKQGKVKNSLIGSFVYSTYRVNRAPFFNERVRRVLVERFGEDVVKKGGLSVYTTIDGKKQDTALDSLRKGIESQREYHRKKAKRYRKSRSREKELAKAENIEGGFVSLDPLTGEIITWAGGSEFSARNQNDHVAQIRRQPGSSIKPLIYAAAIQDRVITASTMVDNKKITFPGDYTPENYDGTYSDPVTVRDALVKSINIPAVHILKKTGYDRIMSYLDKALPEAKGRFSRTLSLALGAYEVSPLENATLHSLLLNGGKYIEPYGIVTVKDYNGNVVWDNKSEVVDRVRRKRLDTGTIVDPGAGAIVISMLRGVVDRGGTAAWVLRGRGINFQVAGKTGTSSRFVDAWFVGYTSNLVSAVWIGNKTGAVSLGPGRSGGTVSGPVWGRFIAITSKDSPPDDFSIPEELVTMEKICLDSGQVAQPDGSCPRVSTYQLFYTGTEPGRYCPLHGKKEQDERSGQ